MRNETPPVLWQGFVAGLVGYAVVVAIFAVTNVLAGRSAFYTAALLGQALLEPAATLGEMSVEPSAVFAYNGVHLLGFLMLGFAAATLLEILERFPGLWYLVFFVFVVGFVFQVGVVLLLAAPVAGMLPWGSVFVANALAAVATGLVLYVWHGRLPADVAAA